MEGRIIGLTILDKENWVDAGSLYCALKFANYIPHLVFYFGVELDYWIRYEILLHWREEYFINWPEYFAWGSVCGCLEVSVL